MESEDIELWFSSAFCGKLLNSLSVTDTAAVAAKLLESCLTLCNPTEGSPPGSSVPGILQAEHWSGLPFPSPLQILDALIFENVYILVSYEFSKIKDLLIECFSHLTVNWPAAKEPGHIVQLRLLIYI